MDTGVSITAQAQRSSRSGSWLLVFRDRASLRSLGCPGSCSVDQTVVKPRDPSTSASQALGLKACTTTAFNWGFDAGYFSY